MSADIPGLELPTALVTGEAVVLDLRPASFATRALAWALDQVVVVAVGIALIWLASTALTTLDTSATGAVIVVALVTTLIVLPTAVETLTRGRSLGKVAAGLRVVRDDGGPIRVRHAFVRALLAFFETYATGGSVALISSLWNRSGKRLGDLLAGTYVVRERTAAAPPPPPLMPPELAGWAHGADIGRIPDPLATAARQLLARATSLHPASRERLGVDLAERVSRYVAPPPPGAVHPERFLAAVLAERRERDLTRLQAEQARREDRGLRRARAGVLSATSSRLVEPSAPSAAPSRPAAL
jgi:uncharacterized RDD family membrane protein YckC